MKKFINKVKAMFFIVKLVLSTNKAEGFVDTGVKTQMVATESPLNYGHIG